jgi:hypothetical protein
MVVNHMNQSGSGMNLKRITMAGSGEWVDSWLLLAHREDANVEAGQFRLAMEVGSRQWGGTRWDLDLSVGRFDEETGSHDGPITWDLRRSTGTGASNTGKEAAAEAKLGKAKLDIVRVLEDEPWQHTKTEVQRIVGGNSARFGEAFDALAQAGVIEHSKGSRAEGERAVKRQLWGPRTNPYQEAGTGSPDEAA